MPSENMTSTCLRGASLDWSITFDLMIIPGVSRKVSTRSRPPRSMCHISNVPPCFCSHEQPKERGIHEQMPEERSKVYWILITLRQHTKAIRCNGLSRRLTDLSACASLKATQKPKQPAKSTSNCFSNSNFTMPSAFNVISGPADL